MKKSLTLLIVLFHISYLGAQTIDNYTESDGLLSNSVNCVAIDANDNIWFGTNKGLSMFDGSNWTNYNSSNTPELIDTNIQTITIANNGDIWLGTDFGAYNFNGITWTSYSDTNGLAYNQIYRIDEGPNGDMYFAHNSFSAGVSVFNGTTWSSYGTPDLPFSGVCATSFDSQGNIWFASPLNGIIHYDGTTFTTYSNTDGLVSNYSTDILVDDLDNKWVGTGSGMSVLDATNTTFTNHTKMLILPNPDTLNPVVEIAKDSHNRIWTAIYVGYLTVGGIAMYDGVGWSDWDTSDGIVGENIRGIAIDSQNNIWIATSEGVSMITSVPYTPTSIENLATLSVSSIYPNPTYGVINVNYDNLRNNNQDMNLKLFNIKGEVVLEANDKTDIDITSFPIGIYILRNGDNILGRVVKL